MHGGIHFCEEGNAELVGSHGSFYAGIIAEAFEEAERAVRVRQIRQWPQSVECILRLLLYLFVVAISGWGRGFYAAGAAGGGGAGYGVVEGRHGF